MHKILFHNKFYFMPLHVSSTFAHHQEVKIALHSLWYNHTYRCDDTRGCVMQFWPPDDEHMCLTHIEAWNKTYCETKFCASSWLNTEINILSWHKRFFLLFIEVGVQCNEVKCYRSSHFATIFKSEAAKILLQHCKWEQLFCDEYTEFLFSQEILSNVNSFLTNPRTLFISSTSTPVMKNEEYIIHHGDGEGRPLTFLHVHPL